MATRSERIRAYYAAFDEWARLDSAEGRSEYRAASALLDRYLEAPMHVLDLGCGPGRYAIRLAKSGHRVTGADLSPDLIEVARARTASAGVSAQIERLDVASATDLGIYGDGIFDAVIAFGPFYHLVAAEERELASAEITRVCRPGGTILAAFIPYLSGLAGLIERAKHFPEQVPAAVFLDAVATGVFRNPTSTGFQEGFFARPEQMRALFEAAGCTEQALHSLRSITSGHEDGWKTLHTDLVAAIETAAGRLDRDPSVVETSSHAVLVTRAATS